MNKYQKQLEKAREKARDEAWASAWASASSKELNWQIDKTLKLLDNNKK
jgi:Fic family protein